MMKTPLSVHLIYHSKNSEGKKAYSNLYKLLCRNVSNPFEDGLDIPVFYCEGDDDGINRLVSDGAVQSLYIVLIDLNMFCSDSWRSFISEILMNKQETQHVIGVKMYEHAFSLNKKLGEIQSIAFDKIDGKDPYSLLNNWDEFELRILDVVLRVLNSDVSQKTKVFISHSKHDDVGVHNTEKVRQFLFSKTKLASFFDVHDILDGGDFEKQIRNNVKKSLLLVLLTDSYSQREWCRKEVLIAKKNKVPAVVVSLLEHKVDRLFPYIGNVPTVVYSSDSWQPVIATLLKTAVDYKYESALLESICGEADSYVPFAPEAFTISLLDKDTTTLYYPEPPLGNEELSVLYDINKRSEAAIQFKSPMEFLTNNINLQNKYIGISISDSDDLDKFGIGTEMFRDLTIEISRHILKARGKMVYGGNLQTGGYTYLLKELSCQYGQYEKSDADVFYVKNLLAWPHSNKLTQAQKGDFISSRVELQLVAPSDYVPEEEVDMDVPPCSVENSFKCATSLTKMREELEKLAVARILIGGKKTGFTGSMAGLLEEFKLALQHKHPIYLVGGFGGVTHMIADYIEKNNGVTIDTFLETAKTDKNYVNLLALYQDNGLPVSYDFLKEVKIDDLRNGLTIEENQVLFHSRNVMEVVSYILKGLNNTIKPK